MMQIAEAMSRPWHRAAICVACFAASGVLASAWSGLPYRLRGDGAIEVHAGIGFDWSVLAAMLVCAIPNCLVWRLTRNPFVLGVTLIMPLLLAIAAISELITGARDCFVSGSGGLSLNCDDHALPLFLIVGVAVPFLTLIGSFGLRTLRTMCSSILVGRQK